ncbi:hypothetical protein AB1484_32355 [Parafrankia sp. FMc6]|uniref:hypothetical protein n=1 Tax=Parafrankia soli TaxID=2599596 RepID=UPI0034D5A696
MTVLIVVESCFGNTTAVAHAVAAGLTRTVPLETVSVIHPAEAPVALPGDVRLLLVGAPTHAFSLPRPQSRREAGEKGAQDVDLSGVREWIERVTPSKDLHVVTFDTSIKTRFVPGTAAKASSKALKKRGFRHVDRGPGFFVTATEGPLADGERERAEAWGMQLGRDLNGSPGRTGNSTG